MPVVVGKALNNLARAEYLRRTGGYKPQLTQTEKAVCLWLALIRNLNPLQFLPSLTDDAGWQQVSLTPAGPLIDAPLAVLGQIGEGLTGPRSVSPSLSVAGGQRSGTSKPLIDISNIRRIIGEYSGRFKVFSAQDIAWEIESEGDFLAPLEQVVDLLNTLVVQDGAELVCEGEFYYFSDLARVTKDRELVAARDRLNKRYLAFDGACLRLERSLQNVKSVDDIWKEIRAEASTLGFRGIYLFRLEGRQCIQIRSTSNRETAYRDSAPISSVMALESALKQEGFIWRVPIPQRGRASDVQEAFATSSLRDVDTEWIKSSLLQNCVRSIDLVALQGSQGINGFLLLRNPIYFGSNYYNRVETKLISLGREIGAALERVLEPENGSAKVIPDNKSETKTFWNSVFAESSLEAKIGGPLVAEHRSQFLTFLKKRILAEVEQDSDSIVLLEDAAGDNPMLLRAFEELVAEGRISEAQKAKLTGYIGDIATTAVDGLRTRISDDRAVKAVFPLDNIKPRDMMVRSEVDDGTVNLFAASMAFYCSKDGIAETFVEWARKAKPGAQGCFSVLNKGGSLSDVKKKTIKGLIKGISLWKKILILPFVFSLAKIIVERRRAGAFEYGKKLDQGFETGKFYAPSQQELGEMLEAAGLRVLEIEQGLGGNFNFVTWEKPADQA